jgi:large subunit ribosomal protein L25
MEKTIIEATRRTVIGKKVGALRREGKLPGVIYGHNVEPTPILMDLREASRTLASLSQSHIVTIVLEGAEHAALVREKQKDYILNILKHVDFQVVSLSEKIRTMVTVDIVGTSPAVKNFNGVVVTEISEVEVEALPQNLPERFVVDISKLENIGDAIYIKDLEVPENVELLKEASDVIVVITGGAEEITEEEEETAAEPEVIERGKKEEVSDED